MNSRKFEQALNSHPLKASVGKQVRAKIEETYPRISPYIEEIWPKKAQVLQLKLKG